MQSLGEVLQTLITLSGLIVQVYYKSFRNFMYFKWTLIIIGLRVLKRYSKIF